MTMTTFAHPLQRRHRDEVERPLSAGLERRRWEVRGTV